MADQRQPKDQLPQPRLGDRQMEEHLLVAAVRRREGGVEGLFCLGSLPISACGKLLLWESSFTPAAHTNKPFCFRE